MTREEAIKVLSTENVEIGGNAVSVARWFDAMEVAISALRQETVTDSHQLNDPLTLDELRQMDGQPAEEDDHA